MTNTNRETFTFTKAEGFRAICNFIQNCEDVTEIYIKDVQTKDGEIEAVSAEVEEIVRFLEHEIGLVQRKSATRTKKPTAKQEKNAELKERIYALLTEKGEAMPIKEMIAELSAEFEELNSHKITPQLTALIKEGRVVKDVVKKTNVYRAV